jgi:hypothetical protein
MPKRSRNGLVSIPARVVAPTRVNGGRSSLIERAAGPSPIMMSSWKSSMAGYSTSSTIGDRRWISSMNSTSCGSRLVSSAARSPGRSRTGPEVLLIDTPISWAMMLARVVLPRPGGPKDQRVIQGFVAATGGLDEQLHLLANGRLANVFSQADRTNRPVLDFLALTRAAPVAAIRRSASIT